MREAASPTALVAVVPREALNAGDGSSLADRMPAGVRAAAWWMALHSAAITAISCTQGFIREAAFHENKLVVPSVYRREAEAHEVCCGDP